MMIPSKPQIIGISGKTGAGKTTLAHTLARYLNATIINWDDFDDLSKKPDDYVDWYHRGQDYSEFDYQSLADVLHALKSEKSITHPVFTTQLSSTKYIIFDAPLGNLHKQTGQYIDRCIHIQVPLDVCLGRRLLRDFAAPNKTKEDLLEEIKFYLYHSRALFFDEELKKTAHFIVDGMLSTEDQLQTIKPFLERL